jgi:hypothetical protein
MSRRPQYPPFTPHQRPTKSPQAALHEGGAADQHSPQRGYGNGSCIWRQRGGVGFPGDGNYAPPDQQAIQSHSPAGDVASNVTPPTDAASSSNLAQQTSTLDATQRRPAYLLHRDLVIGKGSYGQVCIASRGEARATIPTGPPASARSSLASTSCCILRAATTPRTSPSFRRR